MSLPPSPAAVHTSPASPALADFPGAPAGSSGAGFLLMTQNEFSFRPGVTGDDVQRLKDFLGLEGWQTRHEVSTCLGWSERKIRDVAESMGSEIVRGQRGFKLTADLERDDLGIAAQAADAALSQGKRMIRYGLGLKRKLHAQLA